MKIIIKNIISRFFQHKDLYLLSIALGLLLFAILRPSVPIKHNIYSYFIVLDITQSMNTVDMKLNGKETSRLEFAKQMMRETISSLPCGTKVGLGMFSGVNVVAMYVPIDVCTNFSSIQDTIDHIEWRSAWTADSRVREGLLASAQVMTNFPEPAQLVYFTDGEEAPKLHAFNTRDLSTFQSGDGWLIVGIGSESGGAIPKYDSNHQKIGYWSHESMQLAPGAAPIAAAGILQRKSDLAETPQDRYVSKLAETYLKNTAKEISADYVRGDNLQTIIDAMKAQKPARREWAPVSIDWLLAGLSGLVLLSAYFGKHTLRQLRQLLRFKSMARKENEASVARLAYDNHHK